MRYEAFEQIRSWFGDLPRLLLQSQKHLIYTWFMFHHVLCLSSYVLVPVLCCAVLCYAVPNHANSGSHDNAHTRSDAEHQQDTSLR